MSARLLKKFLEEQEAQGQQRGKSARPDSKEEHQVDNGDEPESPDSPTRDSINPFDLLNDDDHLDDDKGSDLESIEPLKEEIDDKEPPQAKAIVLQVPSTNQKTKKKKKKKNKEFPSLRPLGVEKPLNVMLENLSVEDNSSSCQSGSLIVRPANVEVGVERDLISILQVDAKFLSAENEMRRIFGSKVVKSFQKSHNQTGSSRQIRGGRHGSHNHRRTILVSPKEHWPRWDGSLTMELLETRDGCHYFKYAHLSSYSQAQRAFEAAQAINDINGIASVLFHHPYHLDSLTSLALYYRITGDQQISAELIAKCLYALECAWHPMFNPLQMNCRLKDSHESNRPFFVALDAHMKNLDRCGCHRSALEVCKLLLSLDSNDPKGAMQHIDYFSLRAEEYTWLEKLSEGDNSLWSFPNFSFSLAVCRFYLEREESSKDSETESGKATSTHLLKQALMLSPPVLKKLVVKVPLKDLVWTTILKNKFFRSDQTGNPSLDHLIEIYVERSNIIWRLPDLQLLLRDSALQVIETLEHNKSEAQDWACVRKEAFPSEKNEYSHLLVSDFSDSIPTMPPELMQNLMVDPRMREVQNGDQVANPPNGARAPRDVANRNALVVLFESMLPWVDYGRGGEVEDGQGNGHVQDNGN